MDDIFETDAEEKDEPQEYSLDGTDWIIVEAARTMLRKVVAVSHVPPAKLITLGKILYALDHLPLITESLSCSITLTGPRRLFEDREIYHWWEVSFEDGSVSITSKGHFYRQSTGGDTFILMAWSAYPGEETDYSEYLDDNKLVDDAKPFPAEVADINLDKEGYSIDVSDAENDFLDSDSYEDEGEDTPLPLPCEKMTPVEKSLISTIKLQHAKAESIIVEGANVQECDGCGTRLQDRVFYIDGRWKEGGGWGNMCAECFISKGIGIGPGNGQLYMRHCKNSWSRVGGF